MGESRATVLRDQGRGIAGALLVAGMAFLYTMETWWLAWTLPIVYLVAYAFVGLGIVFVASRVVGFRADEQRHRDRSLLLSLTSFTELLLQSFVTAYLVLLLIGVLQLGDSLTTAVRLGLIQAVPLGFGAALANATLSGSGEADEEEVFPRNVPIFVMGALFVVFPIAPTQEMELIAAHMTWERAPLLVVASVATAYLVLYELGFRDQDARTQRDWPYQVGTAFIIYALAAAVSAALLVGFGHYIDTTPLELVQQVVVLAFPASVGASAGEVVI